MQQHDGQIDLLARCAQLRDVEVLRSLVPQILRATERCGVGDSDGPRLLSSRWTRGRRFHRWDHGGDQGGDQSGDLFFGRFFELVEDLFLGRERLVGSLSVVFGLVEPLGLSLERRAFEGLEGHERLARRVGAREFLHEQIDELNVRILQARDDLIDGGSLLIGRRPQHDHEHRAIDARVEHFDARERREENLALERVLREPREIAAAVDEALVDLEDDARRILILSLFIRTSVRHRHLVVERCAHEARLHAPLDAMLVLLE